MTIAKVLAVCALMSAALPAAHMEGVPAGSRARAALTPRSLTPKSLTPKTEPGKPVKRSQIIMTGDTVLAQFVDGGAWATETMFVNLDSRSVTFAVYFFDDGGMDWEVPIRELEGSYTGVLVQLNPFESIGFTTTGTSAVTRQGWALVYPDDPTYRIGTYGIFRFRNPGMPDYEATVPVTSEYDYWQVLMFDNRDDPSTGRPFSTGLAVANPLNWSQTFTVTVIDEFGTALETRSFTLPAMGHTAFSVPVELASTRGIRGTLEIVTDDWGVGVLGLRFNPTGPFTSMHTLSNVDWFTY